MHASYGWASHPTGDAGELAAAWPVLAEVLWCLQTVERSDDWELRDLITPTMIPAALDLQGRLLRSFASEYGEPR